jgi:DNA-binding CsgD family transcriptional regulator
MDTTGSKSQNPIKKDRSADKPWIITRAPVLSAEERDILILISRHPSGKHLSNNEIGEQLGIPVSRVKSLIHQACVKLKAHNRNEAVFLAMRRGEINLNELLSVDELAEILCSVDPVDLRAIANRVRHNQVQRMLPEKSEPIIHEEYRQAGRLTNRERDVLILASNGLTNTEIAKKLCMSASAVRMFLYRAFTKLGARRKADAVQLALKQREITVSEISSLDELAYFLAPFGAELIDQIAKLVAEKGV